MQDGIVSCKIWVIARAKTIKHRIWAKWWCVVQTENCNAVVAIRLADLTIARGFADVA